MKVLRLKLLTDVRLKDGKYGDEFVAEKYPMTFVPECGGGIAIDCKGERVFVPMHNVRQIITEAPAAQAKR